MKIEGISNPPKSLSESVGSDSLPPYSGNETGQSFTNARYTEYEYGDFGTMATEVTTITTRNRYRV